MAKENQRRPNKPGPKRTSSDRPPAGRYSSKPRPTGRPPIDRKPAIVPPPEGLEGDNEEGMRLNKFVAHCGICSRRQAADLVKQGQVSVNNQVVLEPYYLVQETDVIRYKGKAIKPEGKKVYLLMNKPRGVITTSQDERGRKTVLDLIKDKVDERVFPVGRLDRETTGLLLLTNDGDLAQKMTHPSYKLKKVYHVVLDKSLSAEHLEQIRAGLTLEDGPTPVDQVDYLKDRPKTEIGITIHIGRNRIVRRIFEHLGYVVERLDRVYLGGLTKKDLPRGFSRPLTRQEVIMLKHFTGK
jgi:23S rRNA pseudouridine2605 synthase